MLFRSNGGNAGIEQERRRSRESATVDRNNSILHRALGYANPAE